MFVVIKFSQMGLFEIQKRTGAWKIPALRSFTAAICSGLVGLMFRVGVVPALEAPPERAGPPATRVREFTGVPTRIVWAQQKPCTRTDPFSYCSNLYLMDLCTEDGQGIRRILSEAGSFRRPALSAGGQKFFFGSIPDNKIYVVDWTDMG